MQIDRQELEKRFASMSDEELLDLMREDLTEMAQETYDVEIARRGLDEALAPEKEDEKVEASFGGRDRQREDETPDPDWHQDGAVACSFEDLPQQDAAESVSKAQTALQAAGIPSHLRVKRDLDPSGEPNSYDTLEVLAPVGFAIHAAAILDRDYFNDGFETEWRDQLSMLSNEALMALDPEIFCAGLIDKLARMKRIYAEEMAKRNLRTQNI
jgi:hypothetical protein